MGKPLTKRLLQEYKETVVDGSTGEVLEERRSNVVNLPAEPPYVKLYIDDLTAILQLPTTCKGLIYALIKQLNYDGLITLNASARRRIASSLGIGEPTLRNYITQLQQRGVIKRVDRGEYMMNPQYFARGSWVDVMRQRENYYKLQVTYTPDGRRTIKGESISPGEAEAEQQGLFDEGGE